MIFYSVNTTPHSKQIKPSTNYGSGVQWLELPYHENHPKHQHKFALGIKAQDDPRNNEEEDEFADYSKLVMGHNLSKEIGVGPLR